LTTEKLECVNFVQSYRAFADRSDYLIIEFIMDSNSPMLSLHCFTIDTVTYAARTLYADV